MRCHRISALVLAVGAMAAVVALPARAADELLMKDADGNPVRWSEWLDKQAPAAVLVWSSWVPQSRAVAERFPAIQRVCSDRGLTMVVVDVQESYEAASSVLRGRGATWLHDRHGAILKQYRVIQVPALVVMDRNGEIMGRLDPTPEAVAEWEGEKGRR
jgi:hypothetical protein